MSKKDKGEDDCRRAANPVLSGAFLFDLPQQNLSQARAILSFLQGVRFLDDEYPGDRAMYGYGLVLALVDGLLEQAERGVERDAGGDATSPEGASVAQDLSEATS